MNDLMKFFGWVLVAIAGTLISGYVISVLWGWFVVPTFRLPALGVAQSIGLALVVQSLRPSYPRSDGDEAALVAALLIGPFMALFMGWIVLHWMPV